MTVSTVNISLIGEKGSPAFPLICGYSPSQGREQTFFSLRIWVRDLPGGPVVKTLPSNAGSVGLIPDKGVKIINASWPQKTKIKEKQYCNKFNKDFKK